MGYKGEYTVPHSTFSCPWASIPYYPMPCHTKTTQHNTNTTPYLRVAPEGQKRIDTKPSEFPKAARARPTHQLNKAAGQLKRRQLKAEVATGTVCKDEAEIYVDNVALSIQQDVPVVPVLATGKEYRRRRWWWGGGHDRKRD